MASIHDIYANSETLRASDLPAGIQVPVVIEAVRPVAFDDGNKLELRFRGKTKVLLTNKTNAHAIADIHGEDWETWPGKAISLQRSETDFRGRIVECVRVVRQPLVQPASQMQQPAAMAPAQQYAASQPPLSATPAELVGHNEIPF